MLLVSATSTVVWPLFVVGMSTACGEGPEGYVVGRLRTLYMETGIREADAVAHLLEGLDSAAGGSEQEEVGVVEDLAGGVVGWGEGWGGEWGDGLGLGDGGGVWVGVVESGGVEGGV